EAGGFGTDGHKSGDRCRCSFVDIGSPDVEWGRGYLEAERDKNQCSRQIDERKLKVRQERRSCYRNQVRAAGRAENQGDAAPAKGRRKRTQQKILQRRFVRPQIRSPE